MSRTTRNFNPFYLLPVVLQPSTLGFVARDYMPHHLSILFRARPPLEQGTPVSKGKCKPLNGMLDNQRDYFAMFEEGEPPKQIQLEKLQEKKERLKKEKVVKHLVHQKEEIKKWNPQSDSNIKSDPNKTLFVCKLSRQTDEKKLRKEFIVFGPIRRIKVVVDEKSGNPKGYAFIEYENKRDFEQALAKGDGRRVDGRRVCVDYERGRVKQDWLPRRLGGGRGDTRRNREEEKLIRELKRSHLMLREKSRSRERSYERNQISQKLQGGNGASREEKDGDQSRKNPEDRGKYENRKIEEEKVTEKSRQNDNNFQPSASRREEKDKDERILSQSKDRSEKRDKKDKKKKDKKDKKDKDKKKKDKKEKKEKKDKRSKRSSERIGKQGSYKEMKGTQSQGNGDQNDKESEEGEIQE